VYHHTQLYSQDFSLFCLYEERRSRDCNIFAINPYPSFLLSLCPEQHVIEGSENDNDIMTDRNGINANAVGQSSIGEESGFHEWFY
jgi:hypothetical protein